METAETGLPRGLPKASNAWGPSAVSEPDAIGQRVSNVYDHENKVNKAIERQGGIRDMKDWLAEYRTKVISAREAVQKIESDMEVVVSATSEPRDIMEKFETVEDTIENVKVFSFLTVNPYEAVVNPAKSGQFELCSWFHGACARAGIAAGSGCISYVPNMLHNAAIDFLDTRRPNIFFGTCTPPDKH